MLEILTDKGVRSNVKETRQKKRSLCNGSGEWRGGVDRGVFLTETFI